MDKKETKAAPGFEERLQQVQELTQAMREAAQNYLTKKDPEHKQYRGQ